MSVAVLQAASLLSNLYSRKVSPATVTKSRGSDVEFIELDPENMTPTITMTMPRVSESRSHVLLG